MTKKPEPVLCEKHNYRRQAISATAISRWAPEIWKRAGEPGYVHEPCPKCEAESRAREQEQNRLQATRERVGRALSDSPLGVEFQNASFENFKAENAATKKALQDIRRFTEAAIDKTVDGRWFLLLTGPCGTGKTHLLASSFRLAHIRARIAKYVEGFGLFDQIKRGFSFGGDGACVDEIIQTMCRADLLLLDDFGIRLEDVESQSPADRDVLFRLFNAIYKSHIPTIMATNLSPAELLSMIGERAADRMRQMVKVCLMDGPSNR